MDEQALQPLAAGSNGSNSNNGTGNGTGNAIGNGSVSANRSSSSSSSSSSILVAAGAAEQPAPSGVDTGKLRIVDQQRVSDSASASTQWEEDPGEAASQGRVLSQQGTSRQVMSQRGRAKWAVTDREFEEATQWLALLR